MTRLELLERDHRVRASSAADHVLVASDRAVYRWWPDADWFVEVTGPTFGGFLHRRPPEPPWSGDARALAVREQLDVEDVVTRLVDLTDD